MRVFLAASVLVLLATSSRADIFSLRENGRLVLFPVGEWNISNEDVGDIRIQITPRKKTVNAACSLSIVLNGPDEYYTTGRLALHLESTARRIMSRGEFVETEPMIRPFYSKVGYGYYFILTDPKLIGKPPVPNDYKQVCVGVVRLNASLMVNVQIVSDGEETEAFQQLLGMVEGMELREP